jgi:hypothetical protein
MLYPIVSMVPVRATYSLNSKDELCRLTVSDLWFLRRSDLSDKHTLSN